MPKEWRVRFNIDEYMLVLMEDSRLPQGF
ncbi:MAG: hypothetical protein RXR08_10365 [Sulfolobaceae archaeon]